MNHHLVKNLLSLGQRQWLKACLLRSNLPALATLFGTNKWGVHRYAQHYQTHFKAFRSRAINLLEIGVGGHDDSQKGGASLRMWKAYFPKGKIYGIDIFDKSALDEPRIRTFCGSQADPMFLRRVAGEIGRIDLIVDDGSHVNEHVITAFQTLFPLLVNGGIYAIEDTCTAYWPAFGGSEDLRCETTSMAMCKRLIEGLNWEEFSERQPGDFDKDIQSLHFFHNLVFIYKGPNMEGTNKSDKHIVHTSAPAPSEVEVGSTIGKVRCGLEIAQ